ncbi:HU family DNA-binding protein [Actibacterium sp. XHP0104]|uniref:HU family DNA-binding protein n=1 Tax=Actibacterium sp. XHP0104 TaxID=2984335 RepID=UPI0021E6EF74|nr:HU family DNA-binding protein [Actibacterium sp. XHP0104]MCV2880771.1 HU family DNA-binding protein [Actibacterium sp. XHP0104]
MATEKPKQTTLRTVPESGEGDTAEKTVFVQKKDLIERVVQESGLKKSQVKPVVEATLAVLGKALSNGEALNIRPLGKVQVNRRKDMAKGHVLTTRIRRAEPGDIPAQDPLAEPAE